MQRYLAEKYMSGPKADAILAREAPPNKKKRKQPHAGPQAGIVDDDAGWGKPVQIENDEEEEEVIVTSDRSFKKRRKAEGDGGWTSVAAPEQPAADEQPVIVEPEMIGGLMSHAELRKRQGAQTAEQLKDVETMEQQETVYRDSSGRKIDTKAAKAETARLKRQQLEQEAKRMEWGKGIVQRDAEIARKREAEVERGSDFVRRVDDIQLNESQRDEIRWNDPAATFLSKTRSKGPQKPEYKGPPPPPNRFGIKPGYRWDGVDRSNGFEKKLFQRQNERQRKGLEAYQWSVDEM